MDLLGTNYNPALYKCDRDINTWIEFYSFNKPVDRQHKTSHWSNHYIYQPQYAYFTLGVRWYAQLNISFIV